MVALKHKWAVEIHSLELAVFTHLSTACLRYAVEAKAVFFKVDLSQQPALQSFERGDRNLALKHRLLDALPRRLADLGNAPKAATPRLGLGAHVIADQYQHGARYFTRNGT
jgi:hypothetical protein